MSEQQGSVFCDAGHDQRFNSVKYGRGRHCLACRRADEKRRRLSRKKARLESHQEWRNRIGARRAV